MSVSEQQVKIVPQNYFDYKENLTFHVINKLWQIMIDYYLNENYA